MRTLYGVTVPMVTPFTERDQVDEKSLRSLTEFLIETGVSCLYPAGTTGEMLIMDVEERKLLAETVIEQNRGRAVVYIQVGAMNQRDTIALAKHAVGAGADGIAVVTPGYFKLSDQELLTYYQRVSASVPEDVPIYLYGIPQCAGNDFSPELVEKIADICPNIIGIKYSGPDMVKIQQFMRVRGGAFSVLCGVDDLFAASVLVGGDGVISGIAQALPEHYVAVWEALKEGNRERAEAIMRRIWEFNEVLGGLNSIVKLKAILKYRGVIAGTEMRAPLCSLGKEREERLCRMLEKMHFKEIKD